MNTNGREGGKWEIVDCGSWIEEQVAEREGLPALCFGQARLARVARVIGLVANASAAFKTFPPLRFGKVLDPP
jgi:hypothetical protein